MSTGLDFERRPLPEALWYQEGPGLRKWQWVEDGIKVINGTNIRADDLFDPSNTDKMVAWEEFRAKYQHFEIEAGDIVVSSSGTIGKVAKVSEKHLPMMMNTSVIRFRPIDVTDVDPGYAYAWLRSSAFKDQAEAFASGAAQRNFGPSHLRLMQMDVPPIKIQRQIARIIGAYDDLIEVNRQRVTLLEEMARGLFEEWFVRFRFPGHEDVPIVDTPDGPLPEGWQVAPLGDLCPGKTGIQTGPFGSQLHQEDYTDEGVPVVMPKNIVGLRVLTDRIARIPQELADKLGRHIMVVGDIVYGRRGDIGRRAFISNWEDGFFCGTGCLRLRPEPTRVAPRYLFMALGTPETEGAIKARATGATMPNLSVGVMKDVPVLQPTLDVQEQFCTVVEPLLTMVSTLLAANERLAASRDLLLPRLISGQLSVEAAERELEDAA